MAPAAGEATLLTVYVDALFTFSPPERQPAHYAFHKSCQLHVYQKAPEGNGRVELVSQGPKEKDVVVGALDDAQISHSYKKPTAFTVTPHPSAQWRIPAFDPRGERKYMYPISVLDLYFWSPEEALVCLESLRQIRGIGTFNTEHVPNLGGLDGEDAMSPVIQRLEQAAISIHTSQRKSSTSTGPSANLDSASTQSYRSSPHRSTPVTAQSDASAAFAPAAYNPAAPAVSETRVEREPTPPPSLDGDPAPNSYGHFPQQNPYFNQHSNQFPQKQAQNLQHNLQPTSPPPQMTSFPPPPPGQPPGSPPPASAYHSAVQTPLPFSPPPGQTSFAPPTSQTNAYGQSQQQYHPSQSALSNPYQQQGYQQSPSPATGLQQQAFPPPGHGSPPPVKQQLSGYPPPPTTGQPQSSYQLPSAGQQQPYQPTAQQPQTQASASSYSNNPYGQHQGQIQQQANDLYNVHSTQYQPTAAETAAHRPAHPPSQGSWAGKAERAEKKVGKFLSKLDKRM